MTDTEAFDREVRLYIYRHFIEDGAPPSLEATAAELRASPMEVEAAYQRLESGHVLVFAPGTSNVWMANPLCAYPTPFRVETPRGAWWGTCIWDALGIPSMLDTDGKVSTFCPDCNEPFELRVESGSLRPIEGVAHFAVPARHWWENIAFT